MALSLHFRRTLRALVTFVIASTLAVPILAQSTQQTQEKIATTEETSDRSDPSPISLFSEPRPIEEITVVGQQSLMRLRRLIIDKQDEIFAFFNDNNSSNQYDIICNRQTPTGTLIPRRVCEPRFLKNYRSFMTRGWRAGFNTYVDQRALIADKEPEFEKLQNELLELMRNNEAFANNLADLYDMTENYAAHRKEYFENEEP